MRPLLLALSLAIALPGAASANTALCTALHQLVQAAQSRFDWMPRTGRNIPGSVEERHGTLQTPGGAPRGVFYAVMSRHDPRQRPDPTQDRFRALQHEVGACLTDASFQGVTEGTGTAQASWNTPYAVVGLRRADGGREIQDSLVELSIASRW
ncbi:hypothetical protein [Roseomonas sp. CECT 9278]|uniref:hypothetical protein n=1 Tax=Roseomonas sp. CECT 9278 TaxID=2845823 RepID=UPI001E3E37E0|nr:hypothetical protein [Roseomonas sp. CECT 9278]CAH0289337.1 hypothetical protein ROS9278_04181 [Roseomonas sp. CECT 9278]